MKNESSRLLPILRVLAAAVAVAGCTPSATISTAGAPSTPSAPQTSAPGASSDPSPATTDTTRAGGQAASSKRDVEGAPPSDAPLEPASVGAAIERMSRDRAAAASIFARMPDVALAQAHLAYLAIDAGDAAGAGRAARRAKDALSGAARDLAEIEGSTPTVLEVLRVLRLAAEEHDEPSASAASPGREGPFVACEVFDEHPADAIRAFGGMWGSTRDHFGRDVKEHCLRRLLAKVEPDRAARAFAALQDLTGSIRTVAPLPEGTMYFAIFIGDTDRLLDAILAPEVAVEPSPEPLAAAAKRAGPAVVAALPRFEAATARAAPDLGEAICAVRAARGMSADAAACRRAARSAATAAMAGWLAARRSGG